MGYDAGKQVKGRKIHALVDTEGLPMRVVVHSAAIQDRDGAGLVLDKIRWRFPRLELIWADGGYNACQVDAAVAKVPPLRMEIVKRRDDMKGFVVLPRRWVVERTFSWFGRNRRLAKENLTETLATFVTLASIQTGPQAPRQGVGSDDGGLQSIVTFAGAPGNDRDAPIPAYSLNRDRIAKPDPHASFSRGCADGRSGRVKRVTLIEITPPWRSPVQSRCRAALIPYSAFACLAGWGLSYLVDDR